MMTISQLRKKYRPVSPVEALDDLSTIVNHPKREDFKAPLLNVVTTSGNTFRAYLIGGSAAGGTEKGYLFSLEMVNQGEGANDLLFVHAHRIESVTFLNVDDYSGILPRFTKPVVPGGGTHIP